MKSTGIVRQVDLCGRIVIPKETRTILNINIGDYLEIFTEGSNITLKKYTPGCHCCNGVSDLTNVLGVKLCTSCIEKFNKARNLIARMG